MFTNEFGETNWLAIIGLLLFLIAVGGGAYYYYFYWNKKKTSPSIVAPAPSIVPSPAPAQI